MTRSAVALCIWTLTLGVIAAAGQTPDAAAGLVGKVFALRTPARGGKLRFDATGKALKGNSDANWSDDAMVLLERVDARDRRLIIRGERMTIGVSQPDPTLVPMKSGDNVTIEIELGPAPPIDAANAVFDTGAASLADAMPEYWQLCAQGQLTRFGRIGTSGYTCWLRDAQQPPTPERTAAPAQAGRPVRTPMPVFVDRGAGAAPRYALEYRDAYKVSKQMKVPKPIGTADPTYPPKPRARAVQGTSVFMVLLDEAGKVASLQLTKPAGWGFDDSAAKAVRQWRFEPAELDGKPVPVVITVEVNYRMTNSLSGI